MYLFKHISSAEKKKEGQSFQANPSFSLKQLGKYNIVAVVPPVPNGPDKKPKAFHRIISIILAVIIFITNIIIIGLNPCGVFNFSELIKDFLSIANELSSLLKSE